MWVTHPWWSTFPSSLSPHTVGPFLHRQITWHLKFYHVILASQTLIFPICWFIPCWQFQPTHKDPCAPLFPLSGHAWSLTHPPVPIHCTAILQLELSKKNSKFWASKTLLFTPSQGMLGKSTLPGWESPFLASSVNYWLESTFKHLQSMSSFITHNTWASLHSPSQRKCPPTSQKTSAPEETKLQPFLTIFQPKPSLLTLPFKMLHTNTHFFDQSANQGNEKDTRRVSV